MGNFEGYRVADSGSTQTNDIFSANFWDETISEAQASKKDTTGGAVPDATDKPAATATDAGAVSLSKEHPSPLVSAAAFDALKKDVGVDLTEPGAFAPDPNNPEQVYFADQLPKAVDLLPELPSGVEIKGKASQGSPDPVNEFLKEQGFDIKLDPGNSPNDLYMAGTLKVIDDWEAKAQTMTANDGKDYPSVYKDGQVFDIGGTKGAEIHSNEEKGIKVYAIPMPEDLPGYKINELAADFVKKAHDQGGGEPMSVEFPMVDFNSQQEITGLLGLKAGNSDLTITQAKMQTMVQMDDKGFQAKQAAAFGMERSVSFDTPGDFQVKDKFIFAVADSNGNLVFASQIGQENWKRPPQIETEN